MERNFREQYDRFVRSYKKCMSHSQWGDEPKLPYYGFAEDIEKVEDDFIHFFQDCLNLRDWISKDLKIKKGIRDKIQIHFKKEDCLRWARDLANATKHLKLRPKDASVNINVDFERVGIGYAIGSAPIGVPPYSRLFVGIKTDIPSLGISRLVGERDNPAMEAEELAILCKQSIDTFLRENKLI